jgi:hypothetical protein
VADGDHAGEIEGRIEPAEPVDAGGDVLERDRPAAPAAPSQAAVLEVPDGPAARREVGDEPVLEPKVVAGAPEAAVDQDGDGPGRCTPRGPGELAELVPPRAVRMPPLDAEEYREPPTMTPLPGA